MVVVVGGRVVVDVVVGTVVVVVVDVIVEVVDVVVGIVVLVVGTVVVVDVVVVVVVDVVVVVFKIDKYALDALTIPAPVISEVHVVWLCDKHLPPDHNAHL